MLILSLNLAIDVHDIELRYTLWYRRADKPIDNVIYIIDFQWLRLFQFDESLSFMNVEVIMLKAKLLYNQVLTC